MFALEHPADAVAALPAPALGALEGGAPQGEESVSFSDAGATFAVFGKAMIGMAGAYVLRAVAESGSFPKLAVVALAIAYAGMWLVWAVRVPATAWIASTIYACTSALILAPMLWELTLRFKFLSPRATAGVMAAFVVATFVVAWKRDLRSVVWVGALTAAISAIALLLATHELVPFLAVLLLMAVLSEYAASRGRWLSVRPLVAAAADLGILTLIYIYSSAGGARPDYSNLGTIWLLAPACCLLLIYGVSIAYRTIVGLRRITVFETGQAMVAFPAGCGRCAAFWGGCKRGPTGSRLPAAFRGGLCRSFWTFRSGRSRPQSFRLRVVERGTLLDGMLPMPECAVACLVPGHCSDCGYIVWSSLRSPHSRATWTCLSGSGSVCVGATGLWLPYASRDISRTACRHGLGDRRLGCALLRDRGANAKHAAETAVLPDAFGCVCDCRHGCDPDLRPGAADGNGDDTQCSPYCRDPYFDRLCACAHTSFLWPPPAACGVGVVSLRDAGVDRPEVSA